MSLNIRTKTQRWLPADAGAGMREAPMAAARGSVQRDALRLLPGVSRGDTPVRVCVVGPSTRFLSGLTYYTYSLCRALGERCEVSALLMRQLIPTRLYPGSARVGEHLSDIDLPEHVDRFDGVDWFWFPSLLRGLWFLARRRPEVLVLQWWTGAVLHTYLILAMIARLFGVKIVIEVHELMDTGEAALPGVSSYVGLLAPRLFAMASSYIVHSEHERCALDRRYGSGNKPVTTIPHAAYDHYRDGSCWRPAPAGCCNILYFGLIRPYKGLEDLVRAFDAIPPEEIERYWLTIVGETWEGWTLPATLIEECRYRDRISFVNRYISDDEVGAVFSGADMLVLPYHRASQSGALHVAMHFGLPVVATAVGSMVEAVEDYAGAVLTEPGDPRALLTAIRRATALCGRRHANPRSWAASARRYDACFRALTGRPAAPRTSGADLFPVPAVAGLVAARWLDNEAAG